VLRFRVLGIYIVLLVVAWGCAIAGIAIHRATGAR
jgi:hypothetical protein